MDRTQAAARRTGALYLLLALIGPFNTMYIPRAFFVTGDAAATARNITAGELTYRLGILSGLVAEVVFLLVALSLYDLLREVDRRQARLMVALVSVAVGLGLVVLVLQSAPLVLLSGADFLSVFTKPQLDALALGFLRLRGSATALAVAFWGLWLLPFGLLVVRSGRFPRILGILLVIGGVAYAMLSATTLVLPAYRAGANKVLLPFYAAGELAMILWLVVKGARPAPVPAPSRLAGAGP
jgi:hypothetical protein